VITEGAAQTIHWAHRLLAFLLTFHVLGLAMAARKRGDAVMRRATMVLLGVILAQIVVAAILVSTHLPKGLQSLHQAVGTLVWLSAVVAAGLGAKGAKSAEGAKGAKGAKSGEGAKRTPSSAPSAPSAPSASSAPSAPSAFRA
jgi:heme A synthase